MKKLAQILVIINSLVFLLSLTAYSQSAWKYSYYFGGSSNGSKVSVLSLPANLVTESTPSNYPNIPLLPSSSVAEVEMSIAASPINSSIILAGDNAIDLSLGSPYDNQASQGNYYSSNQGESWTGNNNLLNNEDPTSDPAVSIDRNGYMYFTFLDFANATNSVVVKKSTDGGSSWENGVTVAANPELDKPAMTIDTVSSSPYKGYVYVAWTDFEQNPSPIMFSFSTDGGDSFSTPINISGTTGYNYAQGVSLCVGPSGKLYATWAYYGPGPETSFGFNVSSDGGKDWLTTPKSIVPSGFSGIKGLLEKNGNYIRVNSFPSMSVDMSHGPYRGTIYIVWANGTSTTPNHPLPDIEMIASNNGGASFNVFPNPIQVNTDNSATDKWEPSVNVDSYGGVNVVFYSSQLDPTNNVLTQAYMARSTDGGATFSNYQIGSVAFTPAPVNSPEGQAEHYMGDYLGICSAGSYVIPSWNDNRSGIQQAYAARFQAYLLVPQEYPSIASAISSASSGQTIVVAAGTTTIASSQTVPAGVNLDILPGATLAFQSGCSLTVNGSLIAFGTPSQPIYFEEATSGSHWGDVQLNGDNNQFSNCVFDGGATDLSVNGGSGGTFTKCTFKNAASDGMYLGGSNSIITSNTIDSCTFESNQTGIEVLPGATASINQSTISDNIGVGLYVESDGISYFTNNAVENNGSYGIDVEGGYLNAGNGIGYYSIGSNPNSPSTTAGAGDNNITGNCTSSGNAELYVDTNGRLYVGSVGGNSSGYTLQDGFNSVTSSKTLYIYNAAMTVIDETEEQWTVPAEETYWGGHGVGSENFYGTVDFSYPLTSDPSGAAGASALEVVTTAGTNNKPATLMTAAMAANVFKSAPDASEGQFFVNLKNRMMQVINDINNPKMALTHPRMIGYLNSLCSFDTNDVTGERGAAQDLLTSYYKKLPAGNFSDTTSRLCSEAALVAEVQNEVNSGRLDSAETLMNEYGKYVQNNDNKRTLLFNQMEIDQQRKQDGEALGVLKQIEAFQPDSRQKKGYEAPDYSVIASVLSPGAGSSSQSQSKEVSSAQTQQLPKTFELLQNYPNPFNPTTTIDYQLPAASNVTLIVYDVTGQEVAVLESGHQGAGEHHVIFNGSRYASGVYFARMVAEGSNGRQYIKTMKMMELK